MCESMDVRVEVVVACESCERKLQEISARVEKPSRERY